MRFATSYEAKRMIQSYFLIHATHLHTQHLPQTAKANIPGHGWAWDAILPEPLAVVPAGCGRPPPQGRGRGVSDVHYAHSRHLGIAARSPARRWQPHMHSVCGESLREGGQNRGRCYGWDKTVPRQVFDAGKKSPLFSSRRPLRCFHICFHSEHAQLPFSMHYLNQL